MSDIPIMRPWLGELEAAAAAEAVRSGWVAQGPRVAAFEKAFGAKVGAAHAVAVSSCTAALHLALVVADVSPGDEVVVPSLSFIATANTPRYVGAVPVFADVDATTQNVTATTIEPVLTEATRAVIVVDQAGVPADMRPIRELCEPRGITVIEDSACALGATYRGRLVGADAPLAAFSFHPRKLLTTGEGGMLVLDDEDIAKRCRRLREHGMSVSAADRHGSSSPVLEEYLETGFNYRMTDIQAAIGVVQLRRLDALIERRRYLAERYRARLSEIPGLTTIGDPPHGTTNYQSFWVLLPADVSRDELMRVLHEAGISSRRGIMAAHLEPAFSGDGGAALPVTEEMTRRSIILPLYHELGEADQDRVIDVVHSTLTGVPRARALATDRHA